MSLVSEFQWLFELQPRSSRKCENSECVSQSVEKWMEKKIENKIPAQLFYKSTNFVSSIIGLH